MIEHSFHIALLTMDVVMPDAQSLKDKRGMIRSIKDRIRSRFNASVAEVGCQDKWQRCILAVCFLGVDKHQLESDSGRLRRLCEEVTGVEIVAVQHEWL